MDTQPTRNAQELAGDPDLPILPNNGEIGNGRSFDNIKATQGGTSASYRVRRLKRDFPEIAKALARGEFKSASAACIAAGFVKVDTPVDAVRKAWSREVIKASQANATAADPLSLPFEQRLNARIYHGVDVSGEESKGFIAPLFACVPHPTRPTTVFRAVVMDPPAQTEAPLAPRARHGAGGCMHATLLSTNAMATKFRPYPVVARRGNADRWRVPGSPRTRRVVSAPRASRFGRSPDRS